MTVPRDASPLPTGHHLTRRTVLTATGSAGLAVALIGCGSGDDDKSSSEPAGEEKEKGEKDGGGTAAAVLARTADIPVGGGKIFKDEGVVVTQPAKGRFKAFSNRCTHKQCPVASVEGGTINCTCHGSKFDIADGSVKQSPATSPLPPAEITVEGDSIKLA
ncbi:Rieske (2Fe-2S) protein [Streptomyces spectabilis]|uniref:Cytochrome bc1 complex Rieske iron-sulfur subunit n=1 Tax=Streptomyces spectabilis TaxID=68270 RepID=A0A5P2X6B1_STRST|nr:Rieske (2Fe-2S) protein [Streptomyces spectabilis]MBB5108433.1 nitrite reductase/ring-hydroxylating ferredoxin subunit [Streptomyces spectabilis]MCI3901184.1 Rieske (2Fe-2S) protein [Streptomyces spectabilis]QEV58675.1 Rieske (2Fe-2S) protein [Streptomyces spectabilis]GGV46492.1 iron-sulfur protein [Streptomyces spectabilis]